MFNHYTFKSGANPFISMTPEADKAFLSRCRRRGWHVAEIEPGYFRVDDVQRVLAWRRCDDVEEVGLFDYNELMPFIFCPDEFDLVVLRVRGRTYQARKADLQYTAIKAQEIISLGALSYGELGYIADFFEREGRKYGLLREFRENAIC